MSVEHFCKLVMMGRVTADAVHTRGRGGPVTTFGFVWNDRIRSPSGWVDRPNFVECEAYDLTAAACASLRRGQLVLVEGRLVLVEWTDRETGKKHGKHIVVVDGARVMENKAGDKPKPAPSPAPAKPKPAGLLDVEPDPI